MARKPDTPCAGCGKLLWSGSGSLPAGERMCRDCRRARRIERESAAGAASDAAERLAARVAVERAWRSRLARAALRAGVFETGGRIPARYFDDGKETDE